MTDSHVVIVAVNHETSPLWSYLGYLERQSELFEHLIRPKMGATLPAASYDRLDRIPGIDRTTIENAIAEIGVDMTIFRDEHHLASWTGVCPGTEEYAGRRLRSRTTSIAWSQRDCDAF